MKISEKRVRLVFVVLAMIGLLMAMGRKPFGKGHQWFASDGTRNATPAEIEMTKELISRDIAQGRIQKKITAP